MYLRDITLGADLSVGERQHRGIVAEFALNAHCIADMYRTLLDRKLVTPDTAKVCVSVTDALEGNPTTSDVQQWINVAMVPWGFDFRVFDASSGLARKRLLLDALHHALIWLAEVRGWNGAPLGVTYQRCLERRIKHSGMLEKKSWPTHDRKHRLKLFFDFELETVELWAVLFCRGGDELVRKPLARVRAHANAIDALVGEGRWVSPTQFRLHARSVEYWETEWTCDFSNVL